MIEDRGKHRFRELDVFRGFAAITVLYYHYVRRYQELYGHSTPTPLDFFGQGLLVDTLPVMWFFMISGFVISMTVANSRKLRDFAVSRFARLFPVYWAAVLATYAVGTLLPLPDQSYSPSMLLANLTMLQTFMHVPHLDGAYWSLAVELCFYAMMAMLFGLSGLRWLRPLALAWALAAAMVQLLPADLHLLPWKLPRQLVLDHAVYFAAGIVYYEMWRRGRADPLAWVTLATCLLGAALALPAASLAVIAAIFALFYLAVRGRLAFLALRPLLWLGAISYPLYVIHEMLGFRLIMALEQAGVVSTAAVLVTAAAALAAASLLTYTIEVPAMRAIRGAYRRWDTTPRRQLTPRNDPR